LFRFFDAEVRRDRQQVVQSEAVEFRVQAHLVPVRPSAARVVRPDHVKRGGEPPSRKNGVRLTIDI
jgi:hypothetical protein